MYAKRRLSPTILPNISPLNNFSPSYQNIQESISGIEERIRSMRETINRSYTIEKKVPNEYVNCTFATKKYSEKERNIRILFI